MDYLKQFLLLMLVLNTLWFSSAWAFDGHVMEQLETELSSKDPAFKYSEEGNKNAGIVCDHCGHIYSHLVAIFPDISLFIVNNTSIYLSSLVETYNSLYISPGQKPPSV